MSNKNRKNINTYNKHIKQTHKQNNGGKTKQQQRSKNKQTNKLTD